MVERSVPPISALLPTIADVGSSLLALSVAPEGPDGLPQITPNTMKRYVSCGGVFNRLWEWFFAVVDRSSQSGVSYRQRCLIDTLQRIRDASDRQVSCVLAAYKRYRDYLLQTEGDKHLDWRQLRNARLIISLWNSHLSPPEGWTLEQMIYKANLSYAALMQDARNIGYHATSEVDTLLQYRPIFEQVERCQSLIDFEEDTKVPLPFAALRKLCEPGVMLSVIEKDSINKWIAKVNGSPIVKVRHLHLALKSAVEQMQVVGECGRPAPLAFLEYHLKKMGMVLFDSPDAQHILWRTELEKGLKADVCGIDYLLESRLGTVQPASQLDKHLVFTIKGNRDDVIVTGINEASLGIEAAEAYETNGYLPLAAIRAVDPSGRVARVERLHEPLSRHRWSSTSDSAIQPLVTFLATLAREAKTALIDVDDVMLTAKGQLRLVRKVAEGTQYDFDRLVRLAFDASCHNLMVFKLLLEQSGLAKHPLVHFYREIVNNALKGPEGFSVDEVAAKKGISDVRVRARARKLHQDIVNLLEWCYAELMHRRHNPIHIPREQVERLLKQLIASHYQQSIGAGVVWPTLGDTVVTVASSA